MVRMLMALSLLCAGVAHADLISMSEANCRDAAQGAACEGDTGPGTCQPAQCCRNDYSGGPPPKTVCRDCLKCQPGATAAPAEAAPAAAPAAPAEAAPEEPAPAEAAPEKAAPEKAAPEKAAAPADGASEKSGCDVGAGGPLGLGALAAGLLLAFGLRRTRR